MPLVETAKCKTAFITPDGLWEYNRVPFGLKNAPPHFMRCINEALEEDNVEGARAFVDDLMVGGHTWRQYLAKQLHLLHSLRNRGWLLAAEKARFGYRRIKVLGHVV